MGRDSGIRESPFKRYWKIQQCIYKRSIANLRIGWIEWCVLLFVATANMVSLNTLLRSIFPWIWKKEERENAATELCVVISLLFLFFLNILQPCLASSHFTLIILNCILLFVALWLISGIYAILFGVIFLVRYGLQRPPVSVNRSLILLFANFFEMVFFFSLLYLFSQSVVATDCGKTIVNPLDSIYFSVVTITTLGYGDFRPVGFRGRSIVIFEALTGFLFIVVIFSSFLQMDRSHDRKE